MLNLVVILISAIIVGLLALWGFVVSTDEYRASKTEKVLHVLAWIIFIGLHFIYWTNIN